MIRIFLNKRLSVMMPLLMLVLLTAAPAQAAMVPTAQLQQNTIVAGNAQSTVEQRDWLQQQLVKGGVDQSLAKLRVAAMTDSQIQQIHQRIEEHPAAGNTLVVLALIFLIFEILGVTDIAPNWP